MSTMQGDSTSNERVDYDAVVRTLGMIEPWKISAILALGATAAELERAAAWVAVESDQSGLHHESAGGAGAEARVSGIYDILTSDRAETEA